MDSGDVQNKKVEERAMKAEERTRVNQEMSNEVKPQESVSNSKHFAKKTNVQDS